MTQHSAIEYVLIRLI